LADEERGGGVIALHPSPDYVSDQIRETGEPYEADILTELRARITGGVLVDVGAMIGNHTAYLAEFVPHTAIHAFEPLPANIALLRRNVARFPTVIVHPHALSDRWHTVRLSVETGNFGHTQVAPVGQSGAVAWPLDRFKFQDVTLLKIDVEGHEPEVLAGAQRTIERWHPLVVIEDWPGEGYGDLLAGYRLAVEWQEKHQTYLYEWAG
jgi:FkbM family methyltransferase